MATLIAAALCVASTSHIAFADLKHGTAFRFGSKGAGEGQFEFIKDIAFDTQDNIYVLDGTSVDQRTKEYSGNCRVQIFDIEGKFLRQFSVRDTEIGEKNAPEKIAVGKDGNIFFSQPQTGEIWMYGPAGKPIRKIELPDVFALTSTQRAGRDWILAIQKRGPNGRNPDLNGAQEFVYFDAKNGNVVHRVKLEEPVFQCVHAEVDKKANVWMRLDGVNQLAQYSPQGKPLSVLGSGVRNGGTMGSQFYNTFAFDSNDNLYVTVDQSQHAKFDAALTTVRHREGGFAWNNRWIMGHTPIAIDSKDRMWFGAVFRNNHQGITPSVVRATDDFFDVGMRGGVTELSTYTLGMRTSISTTLPYNVTHEVGKPVEVAFKVANSRRRIDSATVEWQAVDTFKNVVSKGTFTLALTDLEEAEETFAFTPPAYGWYGVLCKVKYKDVVLSDDALNIGVTPAFPGMPVAAPDAFKGRWDDIARQAFAGQTSYRGLAKNNPGTLGDLEKSVELSEQFPAVNFYAQFQMPDDAKPENVRAVVEQFKGRVKAWEVINEPNLGHVGSADKYVELLRAAAAVIREADPEAKIIGPNTCGMNLGWNRRFLELGGGELIDIYSVHDYEGDEAVDPIHWRWIYAEMRKLKEEFGVGEMPIWQTERGFTVMRMRSFLPHIQAMRMLLHIDLLESFGIPVENNHIYYLNNAGYGGYPAYSWSDRGPHPAALATRARYAMIDGRKFAGELDFGEKVGMWHFFGLRFAGADGDTYILRNFGVKSTDAAETELRLDMKNADGLEVFDAFGNRLAANVADGVLTIQTAQLPTYVRVPKGGSLASRVVDFGTDIAPDATVTMIIDGEEREFPTINNGLRKASHRSYKPTLEGRQTTFETIKEFPAFVVLKFPETREADRMVIYGVRPDNPHCSLLEFDVQYEAAPGKWETIKSFKNEMPLSEHGAMPHAIAVNWVEDSNMFNIPFGRTVKAANFRVKINRVSLGLLSNDPIALQCWGGEMQQRIQLKQIEIYGK